FPAGRVTGLLADWLNTSPELVLAPIIPELRLRVPTFAHGMVTYTEQLFSLTPDNRVPVSLGAEHRQLVLECAPPGAPAPITQTEERRERYGPVTRCHTGGLSFMGPAREFARGVLDLEPVWPSRLNWLWSFGNTLDILWQWHRMKQVARQSHEDIEG